MTRPMSEEREKLEPCPFCGDEMLPRHALWPSEGDSDGIIHAHPTECPAEGFSIGTADEGVSVAAAWNRRSTSSAERGTREAAIALNDEIDRMWNDVHRFNPPSWESHAKAICAAQQRLYAALSSKGEG